VTYVPVMNCTRHPFIRPVLCCAFTALFTSVVIAAAPAARWQAGTDRYIEFDRTNPPPSDAVVFTGSSSIEMWRTLHADFPDIPVVNRGIGGTWLADLLEFAPRLVYPLKPRTIVVYAGENDLQDGRSAEDVVTAFEQLRAQIHQEAPGAHLVFLALKPSPSRCALLPAMREANVRIAKLCDGDPACTFVDVFTPMLNADGEPRDELFLADKLHMNAEGYKLWTKLVAPVLHPAK
jgi:lysophospholipase L1-like esterase